MWQVFTSTKSLTNFFDNFSGQEERFSQDYEMLVETTTLRHKELSGRVIAAAIEVHQRLGPGFLESVYESALCIELELRGVRYERQKVITLTYRGRNVGEHRLDLLVEGVLAVELKAVKALEDIFFAITRSYMKAVEVDDGMLLNFASMPLTVKRVGREQSQYQRKEKLGQFGNQELRQTNAANVTPEDFSVS